MSEQKIIVSISDFSPMLRSAEYLFKGLRAAGADGVELWVGFKSRWAVSYYQRLSAKYGLPIVSLHQPLWSMVGWLFDERFFELATRLGVSSVTCHPLPNASLNSHKMQAYFRRLRAVQDRIGVSVLIENLPQHYRNPLLKSAKPAADTTKVESVKEATAKHGLGVTLDIDHAHLPEPHLEPWFKDVIKMTKNIHLSSFADSQRHMPLYEGDLDTAGLLTWLHQNNYDDQITLEISCPRSITLLNYQFETIGRSIELIRSIDS